MAERSHTEDVGAAVALLTALLEQDDEALRLIVRQASRSPAEVMGAVTHTARIAVELLRALSTMTEDDPLDVLRELATEVHKEALQNDETLGRPLPGSAYFVDKEPPQADFLAGQIIQDAAVLLDRVGRLLSPDEVEDHDGNFYEPEPTVEDRRVLWEVGLFLSEAADYYRESPGWDFDDTTDDG